MLGSWEGGFVHPLGQPRRLGVGVGLGERSSAPRGQGRGWFLPHKPQLPRQPCGMGEAVSSWHSWTGWGGHCVVRTDWVCALSCLGHWLHCLESPGPGDTAEPTRPSKQDFASSPPTKERDVGTESLSWKAPLTGPRTHESGEMGEGIQVQLESRSGSR